MQDPLQHLNGLFGDRYRFLTEVGRGGLGTVFGAEDLRYHRRVAVKVLFAQEAGEKAAQRFLKEIEIAARLSHPHIVPIFDSGARDGVHFFVMPLAEGGSLRTRLEREGAFPVGDALRIGCETLDALRCAHAQGVIHLDVKPENLLLSPEHALLADFGISRVLQPGGFGWKKGEEPSAGTALYMAPEQASKKRRPDPRSDLYSVGCVLYEMLSGEPPFRGPTYQAILKKHLSEAPFPLTTRSSVPANLDGVVRRALAKEPADRYRDADEFLRALKEAESRTSLPPEGWRRRATDREGGEVSSCSAGERERRGAEGPGGGDPPGSAARPFGPRDDQGGLIVVWIVEDQPRTRAEVQRLIEAAEGMTCPKAFDSGEALMESLRFEWAPDVAIMDIGLPGMSGIEATALLKRASPGTEVIMLTVHEDFDRVFRAFQAGAISYLDKSASDEEILRAVRVARRGGSVMTPPIARRFLSMFQQVQNTAWAYQLSPGDVDILSGLVGGKGMDEIGADLGLEQEDLESRLRMVHAKLHVNHAFPLK